MGLLELLGVFLFYTIITFGNALVMFPILNQELVVNRGILSAEQLLFAFAVARVTPGLINLYVAVIGYMLYGFFGAIASMVVVTVPMFIIIPFHHGYQRIKENAFVSNFIIGITATSIGLIIAALFEIGKITLTGLIPWTVFATTILLSRVIKNNTFLCFLLGSILGIVLKLIIG